MYSKFKKLVSAILNWGIPLKDPWGILLALVIPYFLFILVGVHWVGEPLCNMWWISLEFINRIVQFFFSIYVPFIIVSMVLKRLLLKDNKHFRLIFCLWAIILTSSLIIIVPLFDTMQIPSFLKGILTTSGKSESRPGFLYTDIIGMGIVPGLISGSLYIYFQRKDSEKNKGETPPSMGIQRSPAEPVDPD